jgi:hypothetical protein
MKKVQLFIGDDLHHAEDGQLIPADRTLFFAFGPDRDKLEVHEIDLTDLHAEEFLAFLARYREASHEVGAIATPEPLGPGHPAKDGLGYLRAMREWADRTPGFENPVGYHKMNKGGFYHSVRLRREYEKYLAGMSEPAPQNGRHRPRDDARAVAEGLGA